MTFWPLTNSDFPTNQTFHQFHDIYTELDLHLIMSGFHGAFATGMASQQVTLTLPDTWFRPPFWDLVVFQLSRLDSSNLPCLYSNFHLEYPSIEFLILQVYYTIPFGFRLFRWSFWTLLVIFLNYFVLLRMTDEGSVPEMRILSILLIKPDWKLCIHLTRSLFLCLCMLLFCTSIRCWYSVVLRYFARFWLFCVGGIYVSQTQI